MQEDYDFLVALRGHLFDSARLYLCNFDEEFHLDSTSSKCAIFSMNNEHLDAPIAVSIKTKDGIIFAEELIIINAFLK